MDEGMRRTIIAVFLNSLNIKRVRFKNGSIYHEVKICTGALGEEDVLASHKLNEKILRFVVDDIKSIHWQIYPTEDEKRNARCAERILSVANGYNKKISIRLKSGIFFRNITLNRIAYDSRSLVDATVSKDSKTIVFGCHEVESIIISA